MLSPSQMYEFVQMTKNGFYHKQFEMAIYRTHDHSLIIRLNHQEGWTFNIQQGKQKMSQFYNLDVVLI